MSIQIFQKQKHFKCSYLLEDEDAIDISDSRCISNLIDLSAEHNVGSDNHCTALPDATSCMRCSFIESTYICKYMQCYCNAIF